MNQKDKFAQRIQATGIAIGAVLVGLSLFINSIGPAQASESKGSFNFTDELTTKDLNNLNSPPVSSGKYMMSYQACYSQISENITWYVLVWDTETGRSKAYYATNDGWKASGSSFQLPSNPLD